MWVDSKAVTVFMDTLRNRKSHPECLFSYPRVLITKQTHTVPSRSEAVVKSVGFHLLLRRILATDYWDQIQEMLKVCVCK